MNVMEGGSKDRDHDEEGNGESGDDEGNGSLTEVGVEELPSFRNLKVEIVQAGHVDKF